MSTLRSGSSGVVDVRLGRRPELGVTIAIKGLALRKWQATLKRAMTILSFV